MWGEGVLWISTFDVGLKTDCFCRNPGSAVSASPISSCFWFLRQGCVHLNGVSPISTNQGEETVTSQDILESGPFILSHMALRFWPGMIGAVPGHRGMSGEDGFKWLHLDLSLNSNLLPPAYVTFGKSLNLDYFICQIEMMLIARISYHQHLLIRRIFITAISF